MGKRTRRRLRLQENATDLTEAIRGDLVPLDLDEAGVRDDGTATIRLISPGWGARNHYYSAELLERDGPTAWPAGTQMFWDHPGVMEQSDRPERSLRDLAATLATGARWQADHPNGPGLYAQAQVLSPYRPVLAEMAPHIGVSIRATGQGHQGEAEGRKGTLVDRITEGVSVDFVTKAGRGGQVLSLLESARQTFGESSLFNDDLRSRIRAALTDRYGDDTDAWCYVRDFNDTTVVFELGGKDVEAGTFQLAYTLDDAGNAVLDSGDPTEVKVTTTYTPVTTPTPVQEDDMPITDEEKAEITESVSAAVISKLQEAGVVTPPADTSAELTEAKTENARLAETLLVRDAKDHVSEALGKVNGLPQPTLKRLTESLSEASKIPATDDGKLDTAKLDEAIATAVKAEVDYLAEATGSPVKGVGGTGGGDVTVEESAAKLDEAFERLGLSEGARKHAVTGRR